MTNAKVASDGYGRPLKDHDFFSWVAHNCPMLKGLMPEQHTVIFENLRKAYLRGLDDGKKLARAQTP